MELCMIGLGKMGANMTERLTKAGHRVVGYTPHQSRCSEWSTSVPRGQSP